MQFSNNQSGGDGGAVSIAYEYVDFLPKEATYYGNSIRTVRVKLLVLILHQYLALSFLSCLLPSQACG